MNTTALFVELIVIGAGTVTWLILLILSAFGYLWIPGQQITALVTLLPFLSLVYVLGIVTDYLVHRLYRRTFRGLDESLRQRYLGDYEEAEWVRTYVYTYAAENVINRFEYDRSRLRIARAWSVNFLLLAISTLIFVWTGLSKTDFSTKILISVFSTITYGLGITATFCVWKGLTRADYDRLKRTSAFLKSERADKSFESK